MPAAGGGDRQPVSHVDGPYALGLVLKKSEPAPALDLFDEAARLAAAVANFWWEGIALMEAAATRGVHGDPQIAAAALLTFWITGTGSGTGRSSGSTCATSSASWSGSVPMTRRCGLHHCLLAAGKPSPLDASRLELLLDGAEGRRSTEAALAGAGLSGAEAVLLARSTLRGTG